MTTLSMLALPAMSLAQTPAPTIDVMTALDSITDWLFTILLVVAVIFIILAAYNFVTAAGDPEKVGTARTQVMWALIGIVVALLAKGLVILVRTMVGG